MIKNPAIQICLQLNEKDTLAIIKNLKEDKRTATLKLFSIITNVYRKKNIPKEELYQKLYGKVYELEKDYLLRNELRILRQKLEKFILVKTFEEELDNNEVFRQKMLLQSYKQFKLYDLFYENFEKAENTALELLQFEEALTMQAWHLDLGYQHHFAAVKNYEEKAAFFKERSAHFKNTFSQCISTQVRIQQFYDGMVFYYQTLLQLSPEKQNLTASEFNFVVSKNTHPISLYYYYRTKAFYSVGEERVQNFLLAYHVLQAHDHKDKNILDLIVSVILGLGRSFQQVGDFLQADKYFSIAIESYGKEMDTLASKEKFYANYITNLLNIGQFEKVLQLLNQLQTEGSDAGYPQYWFSIYKLIAYIGLNNTTEIKAALPANFNEVPMQHRIYFRIINSIYFYLTNQAEFAFKETYNLLHTKLAEEYGKEQLAIIELMEWYFQWIDKNNGLKNISEKEITKLKNQINVIDQQLLNDINILPIYIWLKKEINGK